MNWQDLIDLMPDKTREDFLDWWENHPPFNLESDAQLLIAEAWLVAVSTEQKKTDSIRSVADMLAVAAHPLAKQARNLRDWMKNKSVSTDHIDLRLQEWEVAKEAYKDEVDHPGSEIDTLEDLVDEMSRELEAAHVLMLGGVEVWGDDLREWAQRTEGYRSLASDEEEGEE